MDDICEEVEKTFSDFIGRTGHLTWTGEQTLEKQMDSLLIDARERIGAGDVEAAAEMSAYAMEQLMRGCDLAENGCDLRKRLNRALARFGSAVVLLQDTDARVRWMHAAKLLSSKTRDSSVCQALRRVADVLAEPQDPELAARLTEPEANRVRISADALYTQARIEPDPADADDAYLRQHLSGDDCSLELANRLKARGDYAGGRNRCIQCRQPTSIISRYHFSTY